MLIFFTSDGRFLTRAAKSPSRKINLEVHSLKFASFLAPIVSIHAISLILTDLIKEALPAFRCCLIVFAHLAQFLLATRTQLPKAGFQAPAQQCIADLSATVAKHARIFDSQFKIGFPPKGNTENIKSLEALQISGILTTLWGGK